MKRRYLKIAFLGTLLITAVSCKQEVVPIDKNTADTTFVVNFKPDSVSNLKNPYMGWTLYSEGGKNTDKPNTYWYLQDEAAQKYAGVYYIRWRWSDLEPEEGKYAWEYNDDFKGLIQGALDRNLRLAFRIYIDGRDNIKSATPQYVLDGAQTYDVLPANKTPYADDEFFLEKYVKFIKAFGAKFNDPTIVDYVDSYGLGWWGEEHNIQYKDASKKYDSHDRIVRAYAQAFDKVINVINFGVRDSKQEAVVYDELGFTSRRDGYASSYFPVSQQNQLMARFPQTPIIAEACYWGGTTISTVENGKWSSWPIYYKDVVELALKTKANYLDLRTDIETARYLSGAKSEVKKFLEKGGYRIYPKSVECTIDSNKMTLKHTWLNTGVGVLPNNNVHLRHKYKVAFALFDENDLPVKKWISEKIEVSELVNQKVITAIDELDISDIIVRQSKTYQLGIAIINTLENDSKDIKLSITDAHLITGEWVHLATLNLGK
ncbi:MAG: hypothetical protein ACK5KP_07600 [Paludibacteraceae bacterium]